MMEKYIKIQTLYKRDEKKKMVIIPDQLARPEFDLIKYWGVYEKIGGTNIRILYNGEDPIFYGRTEEAIIPDFLMKALKKMFPKEKLAKVFPDAKNGVVLYGEGYGPKIEAEGGKYSEEHSFVLFDAWIDGWWIEQDNVADIAKKLGIEVVPCFGIMKVDEIVEFVKSLPLSQFSKEKMMMEGVVAKSSPLVLFRDKTPIYFKLKCKDFIKLKREDKDAKTKS